MQRTRSAKHRLLVLAVAGIAFGVCPPSRADEFATIPASAMPARESDLLGLIADAQKQYATSHSASPAKDARMSLQIHVIPFMRVSQRAENWVGTVKGAGTTAGGNRWITIDIGNGATVSTWLDERQDQTVGTLLKERTPLFAVSKTAKLGQPVTFSGIILKSVLASDDDMVARPQFIVRFTALKIGL